jgi:hypothetical protein
MRCIVPLIAFLLLAGLPGVGRSETKLPLKSVHMDLPDPGTQFSGPGSDVVNTNCLACHSADMVLNQPPLSRTAWMAIVQKMAHTYKAPIDEDDVNPILDYLTGIKGQR